MLIHSLPWRGPSRILLALASVTVSVIAPALARAELPACCGGESLRNYYAPMSNASFGYWRTQWRPWSQGEISHPSYHGSPTPVITEPTASPYQPGHSWSPVEPTSPTLQYPATTLPVAPGTTPQPPVPPPPALPHPGSVNPMSWQSYGRPLPVSSGQPTIAVPPPVRAPQQRPAIRLRHPRETRR